MPSARRALGLLAIVVGLAVAPVAARSQDAGIELRPRWAPGDGQRLALVREREQARAAATRRSRSSSDVDVTVLATLPDGLVVQWAFGAVRVETDDARLDPITAELAGLAQSLRYELELDTAGNVRRLRNWPEVKALAGAALTRVLDRLAGLGVPAQTRQMVRDQATALFSTEDQVLAHSLREVRLYHAAFGRRYVAGAPIVLDERLPNAFGGEPFPARVTIALDRVDAATRQAHISWRQAVEPAAARRIMLKVLGDLASRAGRPGPTEADIPSVTVEDVAQLAVDLDTGWLRSATHRRTSRVGPNATIDTSTITQRPR